MELLTRARAIGDEAEPVARTKLGEIEGRRVADTRLAVTPATEESCRRRVDAALSALAYLPAYARGVLMVAPGDRQ
jgi:hypothetical protein